MKITIITPLWREELLNQVAASIPRHFRWIVVCGYKIPEKLLPTNGEFYAIASHSGIDKRNFAMNLVTDGHLFFLDDDTILHPDFEKLLEVPEKYDFIHFNQHFLNGKKRKGGIVERGKIDTGSYLISRKLIGDTQWKKTPAPDYFFAKKCLDKAIQPLYINKAFSYYNALKKK
jgi:hypothetical protein